MTAANLTDKDRAGSMIIWACVVNPHKNFGFVEFRTIAEATSAIALNSRPTQVASLRSSATPFDGYKFRPIEEHVVSREMGRRYSKDVDDYAKCDVVIVGAGSAGLSCAYELSKFPEVKVALVEQSVSPGGGA